MAKELPKLTLNPLDELFSTEQDRSDANLERVQILRCEEFDSFVCITPCTELSFITASGSSTIRRKPTALLNSIQTAVRAV